MRPFLSPSSRGPRPRPTSAVEVKAAAQRHREAARSGLDADEHVGTIARPSGDIPPPPIASSISAQCIRTLALHAALDSPHLSTSTAYAFDADGPADTSSLFAHAHPHPHAPAPAHAHARPHSHAHRPPPAPPPPPHHPPSNSPS